MWMFLYIYNISSNITAHVLISSDSTEMDSYCDASYCDINFDSQILYNSAINSLL